ncbi:FliC/FljB family flagellin [Cobetia sp. 1AS1]|uniref:FliC/FljB family flagellin n=1 Tax=Cobetia sp. 1AS1 TaxID=3040016 RepID=UPI00244817DC|nr:FliC/FljB family flagellin [Cobetia sp. 1AS1]MDH2293897.1 FliC/FljB family flagellin [Cobetia sp. 1AS1]
MASVINTNTLSMVTQQNLNQSQNALNTSMERLSSGLRINSAKDDAAGQAIANRMDSQITGLSQAQRNANDGISVAQTAEGALNQVNDNLQRVRELTVQAANGTNSASDLESIQNEIGQRLDEINRISEQTSFNGTNVLDGSKTEINIQVGSEDGQTITLNLSKINSETLGLKDFRVSDGIDDTIVDTAAATTARVGDKTTLSTAVDSDAADLQSEGVFELKDGTGYAVKADNGNYYSATVNDTTGAVGFDSNSTALAADSINESTEITSVKKDVTLDTTNLNSNQTVYDYKSTEDGAPDYVVKDTSDPNATKFYEAEISSSGEVSIGEELSTSQKTVDPLSALDDALNQVDELRSDLGAVQNRFDSAITNLATTETNLASAQSRIQDADYAEEVSSMTTAQILQQAGTSMLTQANQVPQNVLSLLG